MKELDFTKQIKDQLLAQQGTEEVISEPVTEEEFKAQLASAEKFNEFVQKMEEPEEEDEQ